MGPRVGRGSPFLEVLSTALHEDYRFPVLEIFMFLYVLGTFVFTATFTGGFSQVSEVQGVLALVSSLSGVPLFIFIILIFKNVAFGLGSDLERGTIQTFLSYPLRRRSIVTAKLLSAIGVALLLFLTSQLFGALILAPDLVRTQITTMLLAYASGLSYPLLLTAIILLVTLFLRRGGLAIVVGIVLYFTLSMVSSIVFFVAFATRSALPLQIYSVFAPNLALQFHYADPLGMGMIFDSARLWAPSFLDVVAYVVAAYAIVVAVFAIDYAIFDLRLGV